MTQQNIDILKIQATQNIKQILTDCIEYDFDDLPNDKNKSLVLYDTRNGLTDILTEAYRRLLPNARFIDFDKHTKEEIIELFDTLKPKDLVVQIQTESFRLNDFRIRIYLFAKHLKVIEHMHLYRNNEDVWDVYINSLQYDKDWYRGTGLRLQKLLSQTNQLTIKSQNYVLEVINGLEQAKPNLGDYTGMDNIGGTFPIGEVFTEAKDFADMNGSVMIYAFADKEFNISMHKPFRIDIEQGIVVGHSEDAPQMFVEVWNQVKETERALIREIGFGLNRAMTKERYLGDITAFERILGLHLSMGEKHSVYKKEGIIAKKSRFHVDLFLATDSVESDGTIIFEDGAYRV